MLGKIGIRDLRILCVVGILPMERKKPQEILVDVDLSNDFSISADSENIDSTVDYATLAQILERFIIKEQFQLLETLAEKSCSLIFSKWPSVRSCRMTVKKPAAIAKAAYAMVSVERVNPA